MPQKRKRIYIVGSLDTEVDLSNLPTHESCLGDILETTVSDLYTVKSEIAQKILERFPVSELAGKQVKDKRGGANNIHSWDADCTGGAQAFWLP